MFTNTEKISRVAILIDVYQHKLPHPKSRAYSSPSYMFKALKYNKACNSCKESLLLIKTDIFVLFYYINCLVVPQAAHIGMD